MPNRFFLFAATTILVISSGCGGVRGACCSRGWQAHTPAPIMSGQSSNLQIRIVGPQHNTIEVYFHNQGVLLDQFQSVTFPDSAPLDCRNNVIIASGSPSGTFAVIYGQHRDKVRAFGWKANTIQLESFEVSGAKGHPARAHWITTQILKVEYWEAYARQYIIRFDANSDSSGAFTTLYPQN